jgi:putative PLP-dependent aminotransferase (TIGR04422 family)
MLRSNRDGVWGKRKVYKPSLATAVPTQIEDLLSEKFVGGFPVVLSSGRSAMKLIIQEFWEENEISLFPYASQCVVNAIQAAGVVPYTRTNFTSEIIYNQWGQLDRGCKQTPFIEDSCDTFLPEGSRVLLLGAQFEVWSLPKILGSRFGAVIWCRNQEDAIRLRGIRDTSRGGILKKQVLRNSRNLTKWNYKEWETCEFNSFKLSKYEYASILRDISIWGEKYHERQKLRQKAQIALGEIFSQTFESIGNPLQHTQSEAGPVLLVELEQNYPTSLKMNKAFQTMHRIESGKRPQRVQVYKFLQDGHLK